jgi:hypothetical protein
MADNPAPIRIATPGGEIVISTAAEGMAYDDWHYAPARRAGDYGSVRIGGNQNAVEQRR